MIRKGIPWNGWLVLNKDRGPTSFQATDRLRRLLGAAKAGHGGTLDPFAEGVLPIALGEATKTIAMVLDGEKQYDNWIRFGTETDSGDLTGQVVAATGCCPDPVALVQALEHFRGWITQVPPALSAIKIQGRRSYDLARQGIPVSVPPRQVMIHDIRLVSYADGLAQVMVRCGKGTYMRALARDLGRMLGCGAHLERLVRTETLGFRLEQATTLAAAAELFASGQIREIILPVDRVLDDIPALRVNEAAWRRLCNGLSVKIRGEDTPAGMVRLIAPSGVCIGIGSLEPAMDGDGWRLCHPQRRFLTEFDLAEARQEGPLPFNA